MFDILIKNGKIIDGTGNPWYSGNVAIKDGKILNISRTPPEGARLEIDAAGCVISPGFCDIHTHTDLSILNHPNAKSSLQQGVTTEAVGQCGMSAYDIEPSIKSAVLLDIAVFSMKKLEEVHVDWNSLKEWKEQVEKQGTGINLAPYSAHGTIRKSVMGFEGAGGEKIVPSNEQFSAMKNMLGRSMEEGAFGLSSGLRYSPARYALSNEIVELAKIARQYGGLYVSHIRGETDTVIESVSELIEICRQADIRGSLTHHKAGFPENWGKPFETLRMIENARAEGLELIIDQYPWEYAATNNLGSEFLGFLVSPDMPFQKIYAMIENLQQEIQDARNWEAILRQSTAADQREEKASQLRRQAFHTYGIVDPKPENRIDRCYVVHSPSRPEWIGKQMNEISRENGDDNAWETARKIYLEDEGETYIGITRMSEQDILHIFSHPYTAVSSDSMTLDSPLAMKDPMGLLHPRNFGTYPKVLGEFVREKKLVSLEEAVRKITSLPMQFLGIKDRGLIKEGNWADITVFNPLTIANRATFSDPTARPLGIEFVLVNGKIAVERGNHTGIHAGKVLSRQ